MYPDPELVAIHDGFEFAGMLFTISIIIFVVFKLFKKFNK